MKSWSNMSHGEKANFWGEVATIAGMLALASASLGIVVTIVWVIFG